MLRVVVVAAVFATGCLFAPTFNGGANGDGGTSDGRNGDGDGGAGGSLRQTAYIKASTATTVNYAGFAVALSGDGRTLAFGAPEEDGETIINQGAVYVYVKGVDDRWVRHPLLTPTNELGFGSSLSLSRDGTWLAIGALGSLNSPGKVYVFRRDAATWEFAVSIVAQAADDFDRFGYRVALSNDGGVLVVGAPFEDSAVTDPANDVASEAGAAYVYTRLTQDGTQWSQATYVKGPVITADYRFGSDVAISGDGTTIAIAAIGEGPSTAAGAVHLYLLADLETPIQTVRATNATANYKFGNAIALSQDGATLLVGCLEESGGGTGITTVPPGGTIPRSGAAYWFTRSNTSWSQSHYIKTSNTGADDVFGTSVALARDGASFLIGAPGERSAAIGIDGSQSDDTAIDAGAAYLFTAVPALAQVAYVKASNTHASSKFGAAVAISDDGKTIVVGAPEEDSVSSGLNGDMTPMASTTNTGAVYVFETVP